MTLDFVQDVEDIVDAEMEELKSLFAGFRE